MQRLEVSAAVRHIYVVRLQKVKEESKSCHLKPPQYNQPHGSYGQGCRGDTNKKFVCLFPCRYNTLWLYFSQPGSGL